jgi:hypothetical protein
MTQPAGNNLVRTTLPHMLKMVNHNNNVAYYAAHMKTHSAERDDSNQEDAKKHNSVVIKDIINDAMNYLIFPVLTRKYRMHFRSRDIVTYNWQGEELFQHFAALGGIVGLHCFFSLSTCIFLYSFIEFIQQQSRKQITCVGVRQGLNPGPGIPNRALDH